MKLSKKSWIVLGVAFSICGSLIAVQQASALAGYGKLTRYYSNSTYQHEVGFTQDARNCMFGTIGTYGQVTPYKKVNSFKCPEQE